jgi:hypothetical protein
MPQAAALMALRMQIDTVREAIHSGQPARAALAALLFINWYTAVRESPVSRPWISHTLGISPQAVREDRILDEALATRGDVRRLCDLFGLTVGGAERYVRPAEAGR